MRRIQASLILIVVLVLSIIGFANASICVIFGNGLSNCTPSEGSGISYTPASDYPSGQITSLEPKLQTQEKTQEQRDCEKTGCFVDRKCYPIGYIKNGAYCNEKGRKITETIYRPAFVNQSKTSSPCNQSYECGTNVCSDNICTNITQLKDNLNSLKNDIKKLSQENNKSNDTSAILNTSSLSETRNIEQDSTIIEKIINFFRNIFK
jgi:hypothetical protein